MSELAIREEVLVLNDREVDGVSIELLYKKVGQEVLIHLVDTRDEQDLTFPVPPDMAQDAFHHPYVYYDEYLSHQTAA